MKRTVKMTLIAVLAVALCVVCTGCIKLNETISVKSDKSMDFSIDEGINIQKYTEFANAYGANSSESEVAEEISESIASDDYPGWTIEKYHDGTYAGAKMTYHIDNIDDVSTSEGTLADWKGVSLSSTYSGSSENAAEIADMSVVEFFYYDSSKKTYTLKIASGNDPAAAKNPSSQGMLSAMFDELTFTVELPYGAIKHNATETSNGGKTLTWRYTASTIDSMGDIEVTFSLEGGGLPVIPLIIVGVVLIVAIVGATVVVRRKRKDAEASIKAAKAPSENGEAAEAEASAESTEAAEE